MGLYSDAIDEFEIAARDPKRECVCYSMVGMIQRAQENVNAAIEAFIKGLHAEDKSAEQENGIYYELGDCYEAKGNPSEALYYFRKVAHKSPAYNDPRGSIADRVSALSETGTRGGTAAPDGHGSDSFDAAFDAVVTGGKRN
jgi:tetratricopeptide (TPR) repeat protein